MNEVDLSVRDVTVRFGGLVAVNAVSFDVVRGETFGVIGPNGAGKSTLFNAISGLVRTESGRICLRGNEIQQLRCDQRAALGYPRQPEGQVSEQDAAAAVTAAEREDSLEYRESAAGDEDAECRQQRPEVAFLPVAKRVAPIRRPVRK